MGRPLNAKYFANRDPGGVGGDTVTAINISSGGTFYSQGATLSISAPNIAGGIQATATPVISAVTGNPATGGVITGYTITNPGSGYTTAPTVTAVPAATETATGTATSGSTTITLSGTLGIYAGMLVTGTGIAAGTYVLTVNSSTNTITVNIATTAALTATPLTFTDTGSGFVATTSITPEGYTGISPVVYYNGSITSGNDIVKQESSRSYRVDFYVGGVVTTARFFLRPYAAAQNYDMNIIATDSAGGTYYVEKLTAHKAVLVPITGTQFGTSTTAPFAVWTFGTPTAGYSVTIANA